MSSISKPAPPRTRPSTRTIKPSPFAGTQTNQNEQQQQQQEERKIVYENNQQQYNNEQSNVYQQESAVSIETNQTNVNFTQNEQYHHTHQNTDFYVESTIVSQPQIHVEFHNQQQNETDEVEAEEEEEDDEGLKLELKRLEEEHQRKMREHEQEKQKLAQVSIQQQRANFLDDVDSFFSQFGDNKEGNSSNLTAVDDSKNMGHLFSAEIEKAKMSHTQKINEEKQRIEEERRLREEQQQRQEALESERRIQLARLEIEEQKRKEEEARQKMEEERRRQEMEERRRQQLEEEEIRRQQLQEEKRKQQLEEEKRRQQLEEEKRRQMAEAVKPAFLAANEKLFATPQVNTTTQITSQQVNTTTQVTNQTETVTINQKTGVNEFGDDDDFSFRPKQKDEFDFNIAIQKAQQQRNEKKQEPETKPIKNDTDEIKEVDNFLNNCTEEEARARKQEEWRVTMQDIESKKKDSDGAVTFAFRGIFACSMYGTVENREQDSMKPYTEYLMRCQWGRTIETMKPWIVGRRYSEFDLLDSVIRTNFPQFSSTLPPLPKKEFFSALSSEVVETRRVQLAKYIYFIISELPNVMQSFYMDTFLNITNRIREMESSEPNLQSDESGMFGAQLDNAELLHNPNNLPSFDPAERFPKFDNDLAEEEFNRTRPSAMDTFELAEIEEIAMGLKDCLKRAEYHDKIKQKYELFEMAKKCQSSWPRLKATAQVDIPNLDISLIPRALQCDELLQVLSAEYKSFLAIQFLL